MVYFSFQVEMIAATDRLKVNSQDPFQELTLKTRVRQLLHTHQGRDKLFKVLQYGLRLKLWWQGVDTQSAYIADSSRILTTTEKNLMTTMNTRRLFRVGRFVGEFVRLHVTLIKCSEIIYSQSRSNGMSLFLQLQMVVDIVARVLMLVKSMCEDVAYLAQKGFLHTNVADRLLQISAKCALPVLTVDFALNTLRLAQGVMDAATPTETVTTFGISVKPSVGRDRSFSLLTEYDTVDKIRKRAPLGTPVGGTPPPQSPSQQDLTLPAVTSLSSREDFESGEESPTPHVISPAEKNSSFLWDNSDAANAEDRRRCDASSIIVVNNYPMLFWADFELHWVFVTEMKLLLDIFVALSVLRRWQQWKGVVSVAGFVSGLLSVYRVWTYGR
jgi:hypothetical protein